MYNEVREDEATGDIAAIYADIRSTLRTPVVNYIWRHLATIDGALPWSWTVVSAAASQIEAARPASSRAASQLIGEHGLTLPRGDNPPDGVADTIESYNRGNSWNLLSMTVLAAARAGVPMGPPAAIAPAASLPMLNVPPFPRDDALSPGTKQRIAALQEAGPGASSGVRPSLWVHLGLWPAYLEHTAQRCLPVLASPAFAAAHAGLLTAAPALLGLPAIIAQRDADERPWDQAVRHFRVRIAEMVLIGRLLANVQ